MSKRLELLFPRTCCWCWKVWSYLCFECKKQLFPHPELCPVCHCPSPWFKTCANCTLEERTFLDGLLIGFAYKTFLKKLILKLKFYHKKDIALFLAERGALLIQLNPYLSSSLEKRQLFLSFVPSHRYRRYFQKGYNQSELLAKSLSDLLQLPFLSCFKKNKATTSQVKLNRAERLKNLTLAFKFVEKEKLPHGATLLIVDDVTTTGATLNELAKTVKIKRPDLQVWGLVLARHLN